jgi:hypothetical protein
MTVLREFDPLRDLPEDFFIIMYGMRRTGKTTAILNILEKLKDRLKEFKVHIFTGTGDVNPAQWKNFPRSSIQTDIDNVNRGVQQILDEQEEDIQKECVKQIKEHYDEAVRQNKTNKELKKQQETNPAATKKRKRSEKGSEDPLAQPRDVSQATPSLDPGNQTDAWLLSLNMEGDTEHVLRPEDIKNARRRGLIDDTKLPRKLLIFDDVVSEDAVRHSHALNLLPTQGRHLKISAILLSQCICGSGSVPPIVRVNTDFIIIVGNPRSKNERRLLEENYLTIDEGAKGQGLKILGEITRIKYRMLCIDTTNSTATDLSEILTQYGPVPAPPKNVSKNFRLGTQKQWEKDDEYKHDVEYTDPAMKRPPPKTNPIQAIDGGRFSQGKNKIQRITGTALPNLTTPEFLEPFF